MAKKLHIKTFGCQMNDYDSARIGDLLGSTHGFEVTDDPTEADVVLLNTCSVRDKAQEKVFSHLGRWREYKAENPSLVIGVGGCVASQEGDAILKRAPYVDLIFGPQTYHRLPSMYDSVLASRRPALDVSFPEIEKFDCLPPAKADGVKAYVSIMEGCSKYCTFCVVPYTRGEEFSRPFDDIITEVFELAQQGVREITLLGQNVNAYCGSMHRGKAADLAMLLAYLSEIDGIDRLRFTTSHPLDFTDSLVNAYAELPKLANHLHLPVQSGSDRILKNMKRGYSADEYRRLVQRLRVARPSLHLSSDFIIGFPGETDRDFGATMELIESVRFDQSFSFIYSPRPGTPAAELIDTTSQEVKRHRLQTLQARITEMAREISRAMVSTTQIVLVEGTSKKNAAQLKGRTENNRVVNFDGPRDWIGQFVDIKITEALPNSLRGEALRAWMGVVAESDIRASSAQ